MFDRNAFQSLGDEGLRKVNEKYNILCPQVFIIECLAPNRASEVQKRRLFRRLQLIENPIVLTGDTNISPVIDIPNYVEYPGILTSEQIARNCIISAPITMENFAPEKLISYYEPRIGVFKDSMKRLTERCEEYKDDFTRNNLISRAQKYAQQTHNRMPSRQHLEKAMKLSEQTNVKQDPNYVAKETLRAIADVSIIENIERLGMFLDLTTTDAEKLRNQIQGEKTLTTENYSDLAYPIYIYYLLRYMVHARQFNTQHLDQSYVRDFRYLHYLNFCDTFVANERSTPPRLQMYIQ